ncbi:hypothetical protein M0R45_020456 [Rubus argutus]|uniref:Uncharacterized protein n=1 Tax=Rubus argutus TaxID=59490 RepID=A0AAW1XBX1_RUBAR
MKQKVKLLYLPQGGGELTAGEISGGGSGQRNPITKLIEGHVLLDVLGELNPCIPPIYFQKKIKLQATIDQQQEKGEILDLSPGSPLAAISLWESSTMILSSLDLCTSMLCTADESAATTAKPSPTKPKIDSISFFFFLLI